MLAFSGGVGGPTGEVPTTQSAFIEAIESSVLGTQGTASLFVACMLAVHN